MKYQKHLVAIDASCFFEGVTAFLFHSFNLNLHLLLRLLSWKFESIQFLSY